MRRALKLFVGLVVLSGTAFSATAPANAANETATAGFAMIPQQGTLYKEMAKPVDWRVDVEIKAPYPSSPTVLPMKQIRADFPDEMTFNPDPDMPVCEDDKVGPNADLSFPPDTIIARCPKSVIGNGTADLYLAQTNSPTGPGLKDPVLVAFNGGRNAEGLPLLKVYGYSQQVNTGVYMGGVLKDGSLTVDIPVLAYDSGTGRFDLNIPGTNSPVENRRGLDKNYVRTTCKNDIWNGGVQFTLGSRGSDGTPAGPDSIVDAAPISVPCNGAAGSARLAKPGVKGPGNAKAGKKATYKVTLKNSGTASAKKVKLVATGKGVKGSAKAGTLAPQKSKTVKIKVKFTKRGTTKVKFKASGKGGRAATAVKKVKVK